MARSWRERISRLLGAPKRWLSTVRKVTNSNRAISLGQLGKPVLTGYQRVGAAGVAPLGAPVWR